MLRGRDGLDGFDFGSEVSAWGPFLEEISTFFRENSSFFWIFPCFLLLLFAISGVLFLLNRNFTRFSASFAASFLCTTGNWRFSAVHWLSFPTKISPVFSTSATAAGWLLMVVVFQAAGAALALAPPNSPGSPPRLWPTRVFWLITTKLSTVLQFFRRFFAWQHAMAFIVREKMSYSGESLVSAWFTDRNRTERWHFSPLFWNILSRKSSLSCASSF